MSTRAPISGVVTTLDNAATLEACLASMAFCDERVVLDSGSTDATRAIAERYGARVEVRPFEGYGPQKQHAIDLATHDWILLLDADEALTEAGRAMIERTLQAPRADGIACRARSGCSGAGRMRARARTGNCACSASRARA
jgi:glycosyltransferase involved in cell wall biosynthesis